MKKYFLRVLVFYIFLFLSFTGCSKSGHTLKIYSILHEEEAIALTNFFTEKTGIPVLFIRSSTGELVNRVIAEKDNPQADILLGGASSYHILADDAGVLQPYLSPNAKGLSEPVLADDHTWTGFCVLSLGIGIHKRSFEEKYPNTEYPKTWDDLINPDFKGQIIMTNPLVSSSAYLFVQNQLQRLGWDKGWEYLLNLAPLVGQFPDSGYLPAKFLGTGDYTIAVAYVHTLAKIKSEGFDVFVVSPPQTVGDVDCVSIIKNTKKLSQAKLFVDFMLSSEAQELLSSIDYTLPVNPFANRMPDSIPLSQIDFIKYDSEKAADEEKAVLDLWSKRVKK